MKIPFVDLKSQYFSIKQEIDSAIQNVLFDTAFIRGKYVDEFERNFAKESNVKHCIGVANGTDAIYIALRMLDIGEGDEVITVANSFVATSEAISQTGAHVVFVDCHPETYNIDAQKIEEKISSRTKAIIPVHLYGQPADMDSILQISRKHDLFVIEDSAQAHFAEYCTNTGADDNSRAEWKRVGTFGDIATFSFYPGKNLGAYGDAGAIITNNESLYRKMKMFANHGRIEKYSHEIEGINSRMDGLQGAILNVKLKYLDEWTKKRQKAAEYYNELLQSIPEIIKPEVALNAKHVYHLYPIRAKNRDALRKFLETEGIATGIHYPIALPNLRAYRHLHHKPSDFPIATRNEKELLSLPIYPEIQKHQIEYVVEKIRNFFGNTK